MELEILISCMHQSDASIIKRTNIQTDVVVVNQCSTVAQKAFEFSNEFGKTCRALFINTNERGLSRSRNMAIRNASADICLFCDDDEYLDSNYSEIILSEFEKNASIDVIAFIIDRPRKNYSKNRSKVGYLKALHISSVQIAFRRSKILSKNISFNEKMGSGTGNGSGEEIKFLYDCLHAGLKILYVPISIGRLVSEDSQWFSGYDKTYFINRGWANKMIFGTFMASLYNIYFSIAKYKLYRTNVSFVKSLYYQFNGTFSKR